jgi:hypothetical protein
MPTVVTTPGSASANSFCSVVEGDAYHATHLYADDWTGASTEQKQKALIQATREIASRWEWTGYAVDETQALPWPRSGMYTRNGFTVANTVIPQELKDATAEYARQLITENRSADNDIEAQGITSLDAGPVAIRFKDSVVAKPVPDAVCALLPRDWGYPVGRVTSTRELVRA